MNQNMILKDFVKLAVLISFITEVICLGESPVETIKQWNLASFDFPYDWPSNDKEFYNGEQVVTTGFEIGDNRIFLATPRLFSGVPATISTVSRDSVGDSPVFKVQNKICRNLRTWISLIFFFRLFPIGRIIQLAWNNTTVVTSVWCQSTGWKLTHVTVYGRSMLVCQDL